VAAQDEPSLSPRPRTLRHFAAVAVAGVLCLHIWFFATVWNDTKRGYPDFTVYYTAALMLRAGMGHHLYEERAQFAVNDRFEIEKHHPRARLPYIHPPFEALIFVPLTFLPYPAAFAIWDGLNVAALFGVFVVLRGSIIFLRSIPAWQLVAASLAFYPVFGCLLQGQDSILLLLVSALGFCAAARDADFLAGSWFGLGMFKPQFILPMVIFLLIRKRKPMLAGFLSVCVVLLLLSAALVGWQQISHYPAFAVEIANSPFFGGTPAQFAPNIRGLITGWPYRSLTLPGFFAAAGSVFLFVLVFLVLWAARQRREPNLSHSLMAITAPLVAWQTNMHDLCLLVLPLIFVINYCLTLRAPLARRVALLAPAVLLLVSPLWLLLWLVWGRSNLIAVVLLWWVCDLSREILPHDRGSAASVHSPV